MSRILILTVLIFLTASCKTSKKKLLAGKGHKFWNISNLPGYSYEFRSDGVCKYYTWKKREGKIERSPFYFDDYLVHESWKLMNDSLLQIQEFTYNFKIINDDSIRLIHPKRPTEPFYLTTQY
jgi:hypothetical protein